MKNDVLHIVKGDVNEAVRKDIASRVGWADPDELILIARWKE